jgi:hypothetical protein
MPWLSPSDGGIAILRMSLSRPPRVYSSFLMPRALDLFEAVRAETELHPGFRNIRDSPLWAPARAVLRELFAEFPDPDGNFVEQFQTSGFDARIFEIYLFALFREAHFFVDRTQQRPDFILLKDCCQVAVEAVTANPSPTGAIQPYVALAKERTPDEMRDCVQNEVPIRLGSPLFSKLQKSTGNSPTSGAVRCPRDRDVS